VTLLAQGVGRAWPDRRHGRPAAARAPPEQLRAGATRDDDPVVAGELDRPVAERLGGDQRADHDLVTTRLEASHELPCV
jgi:hypothetical protein